MSNNNTLSPKDMECIERLVFKANDDIAVSIARSFERLEERVDAMESRLYGRLGDIEAVTTERSI